MLARLIAATAVLVTLVMAIPARAEISIQAHVEPPIVSLGSQAQLIVTIDGKFRKNSKPEIPAIDAFDIYQSGSSQSFSLSNGVRTASLRFTYVIVAKQEGTYKIGPITFETDDKIYTAAPVEVQVVKAQTQLPPPTQTDDGDVDGAPIFIEAEVDRDTVYVNQQITWKLGFYTDGRVDLLRSPEYSPPQSEGFWVEDLPPQRNDYEMVDGRKYLVNEILRAFFPTAPGAYEIGSAKVEIVIDDFTNRRRTADDLFNLRGRFGFGKPRTLTTEPVEITVLPLPERGRPAGFSGLVGRDLEMSLSTDKQEVPAGEPVNVTLEITGSGNFKTMAAPEIPDIEGFKMYESGSTSELFKDNYVVTGRKITNFVLIPRDEGETVIPQVKLWYFDPYEKRYRSIESQPLRLTVTPGVEGEGGTRVVFTGSGEDIEVLGRDIHHIRPVPAQVSPAGTPFYTRKLYYALHALPLLAVALSLVVERRRRRWLGDAPRARARQAAREAGRRLAEASKLADAGRSEETFSAVSTAVRGYLADKMNVSAAGLTDDDIQGYLSRRGVGEDDRGAVRSVLSTCDGARYSAASTSVDTARRTLEDARGLIKKLEGELAS